jgi:secretion/DNA translocation related TadE-like protein
VGVIRRDDRGAAIVWSLALVTVIVLVGFVCAAVVVQVVARQRLMATADIAALAAAQSVESPCAAAAHVASANNANLVACGRDGADVIITVSATVPELVRRMTGLLGNGATDLTATARAGPPT